MLGKIAFQLELSEDLIIAPLSEDKDIFRVNTLFEKTDGRLQS